MEPGILLLIVFIIAPLIEKLLKAGKQQAPPDEPRLPPREPRRHLPQDTEADRHGWQAEPGQVVIARREERDPAADMLPDDLWEILTGEKRTPNRPPAPTAPERVEPAEGVYTGGEAYAEEESLETEYLEGWVSAPPAEAYPIPEVTYGRPLPVRAAPEIVSREELNIDGKVRHEEFHTRMEQLGAPARVRGIPRLKRDFASRADLRRAIIMAEVLGRPKGLE